MSRPYTLCGEELILYILFCSLRSMKIILASQSPFRKLALGILGINYETIPSNFDESSILDDNPKILARKLSEAKALSVGRSNEGVIIASDLFVVLDDEILEKPKDEKEALEMLKMLSGNSFDIVTGLAVYNTETKRLLSTTECCGVIFRDLSECEIKDYIARYPVLKCAGAFEGDGLLRFAEQIKGNYNFRAAIPVNKLVSFLRENEVVV